MFTVDRGDQMPYRPSAERWRLLGGFREVGEGSDIDRLDLARDAAEEISARFVELSAFVNSGEFMRDADTQAALVVNVQNQLEALAMVAECAQEVFFGRCGLELAMLEAAEGGVSKKLIGKAVGLERTSVYPWLKRARNFKRKLRTDVLYRQARAEGTYMQCLLCGMEFEQPQFCDARPAMYGHWTTSHGWNPLDDPAEPDEPAMPEASPRVDVPQRISQPRRPMHIRSRVALPQSFGGDVAEVLEEFAKRADEEFQALEAHIDYHRSEATSLAEIIEIGERLQRQALMLGLAVLLAMDLGIKREMIAKAAGKSEPTVYRWAANVRTLINRMREHTRQETDPDGDRILVCGLCDERYEFSTVSATSTKRGRRRRTGQSGLCTCTGPRSTTTTILDWGDSGRALRDSRRGSALAIEAVTRSDPAPIIAAAVEPMLLLFVDLIRKNYGAISQAALALPSPSPAPWWGGGGILR